MMVLILMLLDQSAADDLDAGDTETDCLFILSVMELQLKQQI